MKVLTALIWRQRGKFLIKDRASFVDPWFATLLANHYEAFKLVSVDEKEKYDWGSNIRGFVSGKLPGVRAKAEFLKKVDVIYLPMNWGNTHWVGLVIKLNQRSVEVFDPYIVHTDESEANRFMCPLVECLPWVLNSYSSGKKGVPLQTDPYQWSRIEGIYQNERSGDCGPVAVKFLEMHAAGLGVSEMSQITDKDVDRFREKYAMDCYEAFVNKGGGLHMK